MKKLPIAFASSAFFFCTAMSAAAADFSVVDINGDGLVSLSEAQAVLPDLREETFYAADVDGDGSLSPAEFGTLGQ